MSFQKALGAALHFQDEPGDRGVGWPGEPDTPQIEEREFPRHERRRLRRVAAGAGQNVAVAHPSSEAVFGPHDDLPGGQPRTTLEGDVDLAVRAATRSGSL